MSDETMSDVPPDPTRIELAWESFVDWHRARPFWGGLLLMLSGLFLFLSGNLTLTNIQVHLGVSGFLSYIVPLFLVLCGALTWATPSQRILYGILGIAAAIYSIISVNLGGFVVGMVLGIVGGSLSVAWIPDKYQAAPVPAPGDGGPTGDDVDGMFDADATADQAYAAGEPAPAAPIDPAIADDDEPASSPPAGKAGRRFPRHRHAVDEANPDGVAHSGESGQLPRRSPRTVAMILVALTIGSVGYATLRDSTPAAAAVCTPPLSLSQLVKSASHKPAASKGGKSSTQPSTKAKQPSTKAKVGKPDGQAAKATASLGDAALAPRADALAPQADAGTSPGPIGGLLGGLGTLLGLTPSGSPSGSPSPSDTPDPTPTQAPAPPAPSTTPSVPPKSPGPTKTPSAAPTKAQGPAPTNGPTTAPPCDVIAKTLVAAAGQPDVQETPSIQTTATLEMNGLSYDGNVDLPTKGGKITVMQFSLDSAVSTPFQLDATVKGQTIRIKSSKLTISGHVKYYATEFKGSLLGLPVIDYTPENPPLVLPPIVTLTDVTIGLVFVTSDTLSANDLGITLPS